jgi:hypothetical protein
MRTIALLFVTMAIASASAAQEIPKAETQIAAAVQAAPADRRAEAAVLGYDAALAIVTLRKGTNDLVCLADDPRDEQFSVACYHKDLEPFMARGRALAAEGLEGMARQEKRWKEIEAGTLPMPREPRMLYVLGGSGFDQAAGTVSDPFLRWVIYVPFATGESTGLPTDGAGGGPWLMFPGTAGAHIMITPPREGR